MSESEFVEIENFEEALSIAKGLVDESERGYRLNFSLKVAFDISLTKAPQLLDAREDAELFQARRRPTELYFSHGEYMTPEGIAVGGVEYLIKELDYKSSSNRAIVSLISQKHIVGSGDDPIPSFMVLQCNIEDKAILYVTAYFRALEISNFLPINLEEIRHIIARVNERFRDIEMVRLNIIAFRAYLKKGRNPLKRPKVALLDIGDIMRFMEDDPAGLANLLKDMNRDSTVIEREPLDNIYGVLTNELKSKKIRECFKTGYFKNLLEECLKLGGKLIELRKRESHHTEIDELNARYLEALEKLIEEIETRCQ